MSQSSTSAGRRCTGLFDNIQQKVWYRLWTQGELSRKSSSSVPAYRKCNLCAHDLPVRTCYYGTQQDSFLYDIPCHTRALWTLEATTRIAQWEAFTWKRAERGDDTTCKLSTDFPPQKITEGPFKGGTSTGLSEVIGRARSIMGAHNTCVDRVLIQKGVYDMAKADPHWLSRMRSELADMAPSVKCAGCRQTGASRTRRGLRWVPSDDTAGAGTSTSDTWVEESCILHEADVLGLYEPRIGSAYRVNLLLDHDYVFSPDPSR